jgi:hypothetical protein
MDHDATAAQAFSRSLKISPGADFIGRSPSAAQPQPNFGISPAKTQRSENNGEKTFQDNLSLLSELGVLCALAGVNSLCSSIPDTGKFARAAQTFKHSSIVKRSGKFSPPACAPWRRSMPDCLITQYEGLMSICFISAQCLRESETGTQLTPDSAPVGAPRHTGIGQRS